MSSQEPSDTRCIRVNHLSQGGETYTVSVRIKNQTVSKTFDFLHKALQYRDMLLQKTRLERRVRACEEM